MNNMKKLLVLGCMVLGFSTMQAQKAWNEWNGNNIFEHVGVGVGVGLTGVTIDVGTDITDYLTLRGGVDIFPKVSMDFDVNTGFEKNNFDKEWASSYSLPKDKVTIQGETALGAGHLLLDIHPFKTAFRITTGLYFGSDKIITVQNKDNSDFLGIAAWNKDVDAYNKTGAVATGLAGIPGIGTPAVTDLPRVGIEMGDYFLAPDNTGHVDACIKVNSVRPYVGLGFGRMVPKKSRLTCNFDMGVQFWGTPGVYLNGIDGEKKLEKSDLDNGDGSEALDILSKVTVYPVITLRLVGRIF